MLFFNRDQLERQDQVESEDTQVPLVHLESMVYQELQEKRVEKWARIHFFNFVHLHSWIFTVV